MGFNAVYRCLMDLFPQIDTRLLKAVAIEHKKDADAAANIVLTEILPYWSKKSLTSSSIILGRNASSSSSIDLSPTFHSEEIAEREERGELNTLRRRRNKTQCSSLEQGSITSGYATGTDLACAHNSDAISLDKALNASAVSQSYDPNVWSNQFFVNTESEEVILLGKTRESVVEVGSNISTAMPNVCGYADLSQACATTETNGLVSLDKGQFTDLKVEPEQTPIVMSTPSLHANGVANGSLTTWNDFVGPGAADIDISKCGIGREVVSCLDCPLKVDNSVAQLVPSSAQDHTSNVPESCFPLEIGSTSSTDAGKPDAIGSSDLTSKQENSLSEKSDIEDDSTINTVVTRSGQICRIDLLEEMIEDAKNNKKNLFMAMESVMNLMREVEIQEKAAKEAKAAAENGGLDVFVKMEELKQMLVHAKETNDMHAGEINGEKAILTTEARELQNRLLSLSEERDKSLAILDEMRETLEARLAAAEEMRKAAEEEKFGREESARAYLAEQEAIMEKVVQESKLLQQQAGENSKLREFLMDRGRMVDSLQGEISVICQDVRLLKEKFDNRVPLSKSVSSSQTACILASSGSSMKSMVSLVAEQGLTTKIPEKMSPTPSVDAQSPKSRLTTETPEKMSPTPSVDAQSPKSRLDDEKTGDEWRQLSDNGWELFENETYCAEAL